MNSSELADWAAALAEPKPASPHARFIPREEITDYAAWSPRLIGAPRAQPNTDLQDLSFAPAEARSIRRPVPHLPADAPLRTRSAPHGALAEAFPAAAAAAAAVAQARAEEGALPAAQAAAAATVPDLAHEQLLADWQAESAARHDAALRDARQTGYQDGYRDGLAALDSFKQSYAQQVTAQVAQLLGSIDTAFEGLEQRLSDDVVAVATALARQVVRSELQQRPGLVAQVAQEAVGTLLKTARQVSIALNPDDLALVASACADTLAASGAQLVARPAVARGGCIVDSDIGSVDACIATRWQAAANALGNQLPWTEDLPLPEAGRALA
jgi:flagellar assembly protein FliH